MEEYINRVLSLKLLHLFKSTKNSKTTTTSTMMKLTCILVALAIAGTYADEPEMMVNGQPTDITYYPHCISMRMNNNHMCGGSLVSNRHVLTAAHCCVPIRANFRSVKIVVGTTYLNQGGEAYGIARIAIPPSYNPNSGGRTNNDICIITLDRPVQNGNARPAKLPSRDISPGESVTVVAWGSRGLRQPVHNDLQKLTAQCMAPSLCQQYLRNMMQVFPNEFCTLIAQGTGTCHGDSGSGVVDASGTTLVGAVSGGIPCARGFPDVFTNVYSHMPWIQQNMY